MEDDNDSFEPSPPRYSRCSLGRGKWFWVAWGCYEDQCDQKIHSSGIATSSADAEKTAITSLERHFSEPPSQLQANQASSAYRCMAIRRRASKPSDGQGTAQLEYLYTDHDSDYGVVTSCRHRIVKKTAKRVYVERRHEFWEQDGEIYHDVKTIVLDREELESMGCASSRHHYSYFFTTPYEARNRPSRPPCLIALQLDRPCTVDDVNAAYRRLAMQVHPDRGGDGEEFKKLQRAYEEALGLLA